MYLIWQLFFSCLSINGNIRSPVQDSKGWNEGHLVKSLHQIVHDKARTFSDSTLVGSGSMTASINRSDCTLTESFSGRYSTNSWGADEAVSSQSAVFRSLYERKIIIMIYISYLRKKWLRRCARSWI